MSIRSFDWFPLELTSLWSILEEQQISSPNKPIFACILKIYWGTIKTILQNIQPRYFIMTIVTPDNHGPLVNVAMWMVLGPMILVSGIKVYTKWESVRKLQGDDFLMLFSMVLIYSPSQNSPHASLISQKDISNLSIGCYYRTSSFRTWKKSI